MNKLAKSRTLTEVKENDFRALIAETAQLSMAALRLDTRVKIAAVINAMGKWLNDNCAEMADLPRPYEAANVDPNVRGDSKRCSLLFAES